MTDFATKILNIETEWEEFFINNESIITFNCIDFSIDSRDLIDYRDVIFFIIVSLFDPSQHSIDTRAESRHRMFELHLCKKDTNTIYLGLRYVLVYYKCNNDFLFSGIKPFFHISFDCIYLVLISGL